ncbi:MULTISPECIES: SDR family NAD(P)-dependent oxidoreductase [Gracilibacillus]|uniref:SDR family NAD(P)-dependent oxidoreductase n=1 Tax=Gracilibacillus TaxID=74385 RepID=UPI0008260C8F|nr:SDR family NAD(P)-dependent oxidoreductase [Gracilibacillus phocaeensis]
MEDNRGDTRIRFCKYSLVLITGAATGIGQVIALKYAECRAKIAIGDINEDSDKVVQQIKNNEFFARYGAITLDHD